MALAMKAPTAQNDIQRWIIDHVQGHPRDIAKLATKRFGMSRQGINKELRDMVSRGLLTAEGKTKARVYGLATFAQEVQDFAVAGLEEDVAWRQLVGPALADLPENVRHICQHATTEMLNNIIDHSGSERAVVGFARNATNVTIWLADRGVGIFKHIKERCHLEDERHAILELSKGKLTTAPSRHTGEGIFFTSRMCESFRLTSGDLTLVCAPTPDGWHNWLLENATGNTWSGTLVNMEINPSTTLTTRAVFDKFAADADVGFSKTHVPVKLAKHAGEHLVSRSQAKRILARCALFSEVWLDFEGVETIDQAFADEIFRVFARNNPSIRIVPFNTSPDVQRTIGHVLANAHVAATQNGPPEQFLPGMGDATGKTGT